MARPATETRRALQPLWSALDTHLGPRLATGAVLCVSGGSDSRALLECAARWPGRFGGELVVASVDHGTRLEAAGEARAVAARAGALALPSHVVVVAPGGASEHALREARYRALTSLAHRLGLGCLVVAHHADDVAEGAVLSWLGAGGGPGGAAPPRVADLDGVAVVRPFLHLPRAALRAALSAIGALDWCTDPDASSERARVRALLAEVGRGRALGPSLASAAQRRREDEEVLTAAAAALIEEHSGYLEVPGRAPPALVRRALEVAVRRTGCKDPRRAGPGVAVALHLLGRGRAGRVDLVGARLEVTGEGRVLVHHDGAVAGAPVPTHAVGVSPLAVAPAMRTFVGSPRSDAPDEPRKSDEQP
ncbi:MAG: hypothetical protein HYS27_13535 [Deltaproteobacteria bacterium]|nr:hypothetical protein [Deltaproteobacteria bacterium]